MQIICFKYVVILSKNIHFGKA